MSRSGRRLVNIENHTFLTEPLSPDSVVIDAGANIGDFSVSIANQFGSRVYALEPHPKYFAVIPEHARIQKYQLALAGVDGERQMQFDANPQAGRLCDQGDRDGAPVRVRNLESFAREHDLRNIALIKLDIEGTEIEVLHSLSTDFLSTVAQFTIEFHDFAGYISRRDVEQSLLRLQSMGFTAVKFSRTAYWDTLVINRRLCRLGPTDVWWLRNIDRRLRMAKRWYNRRKVAQ